MRTGSNHPLEELLGTWWDQVLPQAGEILAPLTSDCTFEVGGREFTSLSSLEA